MVRKHPDFPFYLRCPCCGKDIELDGPIVLNDIAATLVAYELTLAGQDGILEGLEPEQAKPPEGKESQCNSTLKAFAPRPPCEPESP